MDKEYLITNKLGAYSSSDYLHNNTRKYHGLLIAAPISHQKLNVVNRLEESIRLHNSEEFFSTNYYRNNVVHPQGNRFLVDYSLHPQPTWEYLIRGVKIAKELSLVPDKNSIICRYRCYTPVETELRIIPLLTARSIHTVCNSQELNAVRFVEQKADNIYIEIDKTGTLVVSGSEWEFEEDREVYYNFFYPIEKSRGYSCFEDLIKVGSWKKLIYPGETCVELQFQYLITGEKSELNYFESIQSRQESARISLKNSIKEKHNPEFLYSEKLIDFYKWLGEMGEGVLLDREGMQGIQAGYHWFGEWGRDTFIAFPGLILATGKYSLGRKILLRWGRQIKQGRLPNQIGLENSYNSLDAVFWFTIALYKYYKLTEDEALIRELLPDLEGVYLYFTDNDTFDYQIQDGFLVELQNKRATTWMDSEVDNRPVIDRSGMAVEIQALWYNFIRILIEFKELMQDQTHLVRLRQLKVELETNFPKRFWNSKTNCLHDVINQNNKTFEVRPNQLFVLMFPFGLLQVRKAKQILTVVRNQLLTDVGLYSLSPRHPDFCKHYGGDQRQRDLAYHQGAIWVFLLGIYLSALLQTNNFSQQAQEEVEQVIYKLIAFCEKNQLDYLPEIVSPDNMQPDGCLLQAWSVATIFSALTELIDYRQSDR